MKALRTLKGAKYPEPAKTLTTTQGGDEEWNIAKKGIVGKCVLWPSIVGPSGGVPHLLM